jgi:hypothetical protein
MVLCPAHRPLQQSLTKTAHSSSISFHTAKGCRSTTEEGVPVEAWLADVSKSSCASCARDPVSESSCNGEKIVHNPSSNLNYNHKRSASLQQPVSQLTPPLSDSCQAEGMDLSNTVRSPSPKKRKTQLLTLRSTNFLHNKIVSSCQGHPAC